MDLLQIKRMLTEKEQERERLRGKQETLLEEAKTRYGCNSIEELDTFILNLSTEISNKEKELKEIVESLSSILSSEASN